MIVVFKEGKEMRLEKKKKKSGEKVDIPRNNAVLRVFWRVWKSSIDREPLFNLVKVVNPRWNQ